MGNNDRTLVPGVLTLVAACLLLLPGGLKVGAHDIPSDVTLHAFVKPEGKRLRLLVRVPLEAMQDTIFPVTGPGYLDFETLRAGNLLQEAAMLWIADNVELYEDRDRLESPQLEAIRVSLPSDRSFESYQQAVDNLTGPRLNSGLQLIWRQALLDVLFDYSIQSERSDFSLRPTHARLGLRVHTVLRFLPPGGAVRAYEYRGDPGLLRLDPRWHQAARRFVVSGFSHIWSGIDHLLFLACLVIPLRRLRELVWVITSFTVAHSVTLIASAYGLAPNALWFPPLVETLIAATILYVAFENIVGAKVEKRWILTFGFGLVHGFGFSFVLRDTLQFAGSHLLTSLLSFNIGVELGQLVVLLLLIPLLELLFRYVVSERMGTILLSALIAHSAWHWLTERGDMLRQYWN